MHLGCYGFMQWRQAINSTNGDIIVNWSPRNILQWSFIHNWNIFIQWNCIWKCQPFCSGLQWPIFIKEINQRSPKCPLKTNGHLANRRWSSLSSKRGYWPHCVNYFLPTENSASAWHASSKWMSNRPHHYPLLGSQQHQMLRKSLHFTFIPKHWLVHLVMACHYSINPLRAKFFRRNINIYLHFMSFLHIDLTQVLKILPQVREALTYSM